MERRLVERFAMQLPAEVRAAAGSTSSAATVRDISSHGASFYSPSEWAEGQVLHLGIAFDQKIAGPYSYQLKVHGRIVRTGRDERTGQQYCAVAFTDSGSIRDWREKPAEGRR